MPAIVSSAIFFIAWDIWFTSINIWTFNSEFIVGQFIAGLPIEEWLFFFITPFSCVFIHEVLTYFVKKDVFAKSTKYINTILASILLILALVYREKTYTFVDFMLLSIFLFIHQYILRTNYLSRFYLTWLVCTLPFLLVDGFITGLPIVMYNNLQNSNIRLFCIPIEDLSYSMLNILFVITIYEYLKQRKANKKISQTL